ncbi:hypothetical protein JOQ06_006776, partial [Pogonophryne albipinna]
MSSGGRTVEGSHEGGVGLCVGGKLSMRDRRLHPLSLSANQCLSLSRPTSVLLTQRENRSEDRQRDSVGPEPVNLLRRKPSVRKWNNQRRVSNSPCVTDSPPQRCLP